MSPPITPNRFGVAVGAVPRLILSVSVGGASLAICVSPGMPVSSAWTMSVRFSSGTLRPGKRMLMTFASSGETTYLPKFFRSSAGWVAVVAVLLAQRDHDLVDERVAEAAHLDAAGWWILRCFLWPLTWSFLRSAEAHTPTTALPALAEETDLPSRVTAASGICRTTLWAL